MIINKTVCPDNSFNHKVRRKLFAINLKNRNEKKGNNVLCRLHYSLVVLTRDNKTLTYENRNGVRKYLYQLKQAC